MFYEVARKVLTANEYATIAKAFRMTDEQLSTAMFMETLSIEQCLFVVRVARSPELMHYVLTVMNPQFDYRPLPGESHYPKASEYARRLN
jgi:hypothetical protein